MVLLGGELSQYFGDSPRQACSVEHQTGRFASERTVPDSDLDVRERFIVDIPVAQCLGAKVSAGLCVLCCRFDNPRFGLSQLFRYVDSYEVGRGALANRAAGLGRCQVTHAFVLPGRGHGMPRCQCGILNLAVLIAKRQSWRPS